MNDVAAEYYGEVDKIRLDRLHFFWLGVNYAYRIGEARTYDQPWEPSWDKLIP